MKRAERLPVPVRSTVARLAPYLPPVEGRAGKLRLDFNENTVGCSPAVRRALARLSREEIAIYPEYQAVTRRLARFFRVRPEEMLLSNGVDDALRLLFDTFVDPGTAVAWAEPTFVMYRFYAALAGARVVALRYDRAMRFPLEDVLRALRKKPRLLFIANPNNPTGTLVAKPILQRVLRAAARTLVIVDEAYFEFSGLTVLPWLRRYANLVVMRTFSKAAGLAGLRLGCVFANRAVTDALRKTMSPFAVNTAALAAAEAVTRDLRSVRKYVREVNRAKQQVAAAFARMDIPTFPSASNFVLADFGSRAPEIVRRLERRGILLRDRQSEFGRPGYVRVTIGTRAQMRRLVAALEKVC